MRGGNKREENYSVVSQINLNLNSLTYSSISFFRFESFKNGGKLFLEREKLKSKFVLIDLPIFVEFRLSRFIIFFFISRLR